MTDNLDCGLSNPKSAVRLRTPLGAEDVAGLRAGDRVLLSGVVYAARDTAHKRLVELLERKEKLPFELDGQVIYYVGPSPTRPGEVIGSAGPTTSGRMDPYTPALLEAGIRATIGKGNSEPSTSPRLAASPHCSRNASRRAKSSRSPNSDPKLSGGSNSKTSRSSSLTIRQAETFMRKFEIQDSKFKTNCNTSAK